MILKGSQRGGAKNLALHLLRTDTNDHVEVHQIRGFVSRNLIDAMREAWAISRGTKCQQFLFSLSFSPPADKDCSVEAFERAIDEAEKRLGLVGQPRIVVFHELKGRRHAHCVWSRIRADNMRAINLPLFKRKLNQLGRDLYVEHGWQMPRGFVKSEERNPLNFSLVEWQQAKRLARDPARIKAIFQMCWSRSDSKKAFEAALEARGYYLAQGDRRGYVAIDVKGEVYSLSRWCGVATRDLAARLGDPAKLPTIESLRPKLRERLAEKLKDFAGDIAQAFETANNALGAKRNLVVARQREERAELRERQAFRWVQESKARLARFRKGLRGLWDRITGRHQAVRRQNEAEVEAAMRRDRSERETVIRRQVNERRSINAEVKVLRQQAEEDAHRLEIELGELTPRQDIAQATAIPQKRGRSRGRSRSPKP